MKPSRNAKRINPSQEHGYIGQSKSKRKATKHIEGEIILGYLYERDMDTKADMFCSDYNRINIERRERENFYKII